MADKKCSQCAEKVKAAATRCGHCGHEFSADEMAAATAAAKKEQKTGLIGCGVFLVLGILGISTCSGGGTDTTKRGTVAEADAHITRVETYPETKHGSIAVDLQAGWSGSNMPLQAAMVIEAAGKAIKAGATDVPTGIETLTFLFTYPMVDRYGAESRSKILQLNIRTDDLRKIEYDNVVATSLLDFGYDFGFGGPAGRQASLEFCQDSDNARAAPIFCNNL